MTAVTDDPFDHNAECTFCDEQAMHAADCPWIAQLLAEVERLEADRDAHANALAAHSLAAQLLEAKAEVERLTAPRCDVPDHLELLVDLSTMTLAVEQLRSELRQERLRTELQQKRLHDHSPDK